MQKKTYSLEIGGKELVAEFTDLAEQANGSVILRYGNTAVLATACMGRERTDIDYFPLTVDYEEKFYAAGAILGSRFMRREGRPSEEAILSGRVVDRTIRPLFDHSLRNEVQVIITILSIAEDDPDVVGVIAASLALATSDIPWKGPVSAVRVGKKKTGEMIVNPTYADREHEEYHFDVLACGKEGLLNMIEVGAREAQESDLVEAFGRATEVHTAITQWQADIVADLGKEKMPVPGRAFSSELVALFESKAAPVLRDHVISGVAGKGKINELKKTFLAEVAEALPEEVKDAEDLYEEKVDTCLQEEAVSNNRRADGRAFDEVRTLYAQAGGMSPMVHGSGIFYRGGTHVFTALTLGGPGDALVVDTIEQPDEQKRFMHHYNFPPFSAGETGRLGGLNRRAVGHGALAEKALLPMLPPKDIFPYTIRLVSECMASNGSTSMASTCAATLALMDGGVPVKRPVAGIAMGLMMTEAGYKVLTDIQGPEDHHGHMDFKVAGTREGVTAIQMDIKLEGVPVTILAEALEGAKKARLHILDVMEAEIAAPRSDISPLAPKILTTRVKVDQIGLVIGSGGKTINGIKDESGADDITIEEDGLIYVTGKNGSAERAIAMIEELVHEFQPGEVAEGPVSRIMDFGAFVRLGQNAEGLVHISEIAPFRVEKVRDVLTEGDVVKVVVKEIDEKGRINLSIKRIDPDFAQRKGVTGAVRGV